MLLSGDLLDSDNTYYETGEELNQCLRSLSVPVFISPGNHDYYSPKSPYARLKLPSNVFVFSKNELEYVPLPQLGARVYGAAFTEKSSGPLLQGFTAEREEGIANIMCIHGEVGAKASDYNPISLEDIERSGMDYIADLDYQVYPDWDTFKAGKEGQFVYFTRYGMKNFSDCVFDKEKDIYLVFGKESTGIDKKILKENLQDCYRIPMRRDARSLNLSNCVAIGAYECMRQIGFFDLCDRETLKGADFLLRC